MNQICRVCLGLFLWVGILFPLHGLAAPAPLVFTVAMSEAVTVTTGGGTPRIALDVGGVTRYASFSGGSGTSSLTFTYAPQAGDVDLDGISFSAAVVDLNGGSIADIYGNPMTNLTFTAPSLSGVKIDYPSLSLDFVADSDGRYTLNGTVYNDPSSFLTASSGTFSRASQATYFDVAGNMQLAGNNVPRFDYDPVTHAAKGLLVEESRTNQVYYSTDAMQWINNGVVATSLGTTEMGIFSPVRLASTGQTYHRMNVRRPPGGINEPITAPVVVTAYYRAGTSGKVAFTMYHIDGSASSSAAGNVCGTLGIGNGGGTITVLRHEYIGSVCVLQYLFSPSNTTVGITIGIGPYSSVVGEDVIVLGMQAEYATYPSSFIVTGNGQGTRDGDVLNIPTGGWFSLPQFSLSSVYSSYALSGFSTRVASVNDATANNVFQIADASSGTVFAQKVIGGSIQNSSGPAYVPNTLYKVAAATDASSAPFVANGVLYNNANVGVLANATRLQVGVQYNISQLNGHIQSLKYYPARVSNAQLTLMGQ